MCNLYVGVLIGAASVAAGMAGGAVSAHIAAQRWLRKRNHG